VGCEARNCNLKATGLAAGAGGRESPSRSPFTAGDRSGCDRRRATPGRVSAEVKTD